MQSLGLLGLVFDTGLSITPLMGHLGCLATHWSVPVSMGLWELQAWVLSRQSCVRYWTGSTVLMLVTPRGPCAPGPTSRQTFAPYKHCFKHEILCLKTESQATAPSQGWQTWRSHTLLSGRSTSRGWLTTMLWPIGAYKHDDWPSAPLASTNHPTWGGW